MIVTAILLAIIAAAVDYFIGVKEPWRRVVVQQLKESNEEARAEVQRRGVKLHPKIAAARPK